jgi:pyruvate dehydrogenase (quinone)
VAILAGQGARDARDELLKMADLLAAGVAKPLLGKDVLPDDLPFVTGSIGLLGTRPSYEMMQDCDTLLTVGSSFPYSQFLPEFGKARGVADRPSTPRGSGCASRYEVNLVADAKLTLGALLRLLEPKKRPNLAGDDRGERVRLVHDAMRGPGGGVRRPDQPACGSSPNCPTGFRRARSSPRTRDRAANWYARQLRFRADTRGSLSGTLATMGPGVPYAIGAKFAHPDRPVLALAGTAPCR